MFQFRDNYDLPDFITKDKNKAHSYSLKIARENLELFYDLKKICIAVSFFN